MDTEKQPIQKKTLRDRKKAQPRAKIYFSDAEKNAISDTVAKDLMIPERNIFFYQCQALGLNPLLNEICAIVYKGADGVRKMSIQVMRDGFLTIAHRSGKFAGIESGVKEDDGRLVGWAKVYHKDFEHPVYQEADMSEYASDRNILWKTKPKTMIKKVAESMALRKAFNVSGVYAPEEMELEITKDKPAQIVEIEMEGGNKPASEEQIATIKSLGGIEGIYTKQEAATLIKNLSTKK